MYKQKFMKTTVTLTLAGVAFFYTASILWGAVFTITNEGQFQNALNAAETNSQSDTIYVSAGTFNITTTLTYNPLGTENFALTIIGVDPDSTILDGGDANQIMNFKTRDLSDDANAHITIKNLKFQRGKIIDGSGGGLEVSAETANITLENTEFSSNSATNYGGGADVRTRYGTVTFTSNTFKDNFVTGGGPSYVVYQGGGLFTYSTYGTVNVSKNKFSNNTVDVPAGSAHGGGVTGSTYDGTANFTNNIFNGNCADWGGGVNMNTFQGTLTFTNNTFSNNAGSSGGGIYLTLNENSATANIYNNIIWGNTGNRGSDLYVMDDREWDNTGSTVNLFNNNYNDFYIEDGDNLSQENNIDANPLLTSDFHLRSGSPCINKGYNSAPGIPDSDFDGEARIFDSIVDIGADEIQSVQPEGMFYVIPKKGAGAAVIFLE